MSDTATIIVAVLASNGLFALIQFLITRHDTRKSIKGKLILLEKDGLRTQLLLLMFLLPSERQEIMTVAEHYFAPAPRGLDGNWYMTSLFDKWLEDHNKGVRPEGFKRGETK